jgi:hypothetical protein
MTSVSGTGLFEAQEKPMSTRTANFAVLMLLAGSLGCASSGTQASDPSGSRATRSPNMISAEEIAATPAGNAYDLIVRLRPQWLRVSGVQSIGGGTARQGALVAYLDNVLLNRFDELRSVDAGSIKSIRYLNAEQATALDTRGGLVVGAVVVATR